MANPVLLLSTSVSWVVHLALVVAAFWWGESGIPFFYCVVLLTGLATSALNHGGNNPVFRWGDRAFVSACCVLDLKMAARLGRGPHVAATASILGCVASFVAAKNVKKDYRRSSVHVPISRELLLRPQLRPGDGWHLLCHFFATFTHGVIVLGMAGLLGPAPEWAPARNPWFSGTSGFLL